jgi:oxygen-independent coproporphyrinogen III oxidase
LTWVNLRPARAVSYMIMAAIDSPRAFTENEPIVGNYFVAAYPPFSCWQPEQVPSLIDALNKTPVPAPLGIYVHVPFCQKKCDYCYYLSFIGRPAQVIDRYVNKVAEELALYAERRAVAGRPVAFVYFGGGTPSMLTSGQVRQLTSGLKQALPWGGVPEVTFECAPRSVRADFLDTLREVGVTRISMGVQSFDDELLRLNGRVHLRADVLRAYELIQGAGFDWVNLDLMCGLLGETEATWRDSVQRVIRLGPESVTIYQTEIPHNTQLCRDLKSGTLPAELVSWSTKRARLEHAFDQLDRAGYSVVSAYNAVRDPAKHEFQYQKHLWRGGDMLGLGVASFGYFGGVHYQNQVTLENYEEQLSEASFPVWRAFALNNRDRLVREFVLQLKFGHVSTVEFQKKFGVNIIESFAAPLRELRSERWLTYTASGVQLTAAGLLKVDRLLPHFYDGPHRDVRYT